MAEQNQWLDAYLAGGHGTPVDMHAANFLAHEVLVASVPLATQLKVIDGLAAAGVTRINIPMGQMPFRFPGSSPGILSIYDAIVTRIRTYPSIEFGMWITYGELYYEVANLAAWTTEATAMLEYIINRYDPDIVSIVHEPTTVSSRMGETPTVPAWTTYLTDVAAACVVAGAPKISASFIAGTETAYFNAAAAIGDFTDLGMDIYTITSLSSATQMAETGLAATKVLSIDETWRPQFAPVSSGSLDGDAIQFIGHPPFESLDVKWVRAMNKFADANGIDGICPIWTQCMFGYGDHSSGAFTASLITKASEGANAGKQTGVLDIMETLSA